MIVIKSTEVCNHYSIPILEHSFILKKPLVLIYNLFCFHLQTPAAMKVLTVSWHFFF